MKVYDKLIVIGCSKTSISGDFIDLFISPFKNHFKSSFSPYHDVYFFTTAGEAITQDVIDKIQELKNQGANVLVSESVHVEPTCRSVRINELKDEILASFKSKLNWNEKQVTEWLSQYGFTLEESFKSTVFNDVDRCQDAAKTLSHLDVDFIVGILNIKRGSFETLHCNIYVSEKEKDLLMNSLLKSAVKQLKLNVTWPKYLAIGMPGVDIRRVLRINDVGTVFPISLNPTKPTLESIRSIMFYVYLMKDKPCLRLVAPKAQIEQLETWAQKDPVIQELEKQGMKEPKYYIQA